MNQKVEHIETVTHHLVDENVETELDQFRTSFPYTRVNVQDGYMNYKIVRLEQARSIEREAREIISRLKLELKTELKINRWDAVLTIEPK